jgi:hypothetical protein
MKGEHWKTPMRMPNSSGFTALRGGYHGINGAFDFIGEHGYSWSSTEVQTPGSST